MIKSMTGYGRGEAILYNRKFIVEIKSVNHRYNDINIKLPRIINPLEDRVKSKLATVVKRGKTDVYISMESYSAQDVKINVNQALAAAYAEALIQLRDAYPLRDDLSLSMVASFPDVVNTEKTVGGEDNLEQMWEALEGALMDAVAQFIAMRTKEGKALSEDILLKRENLIRFAAMLWARAPLVASEYEIRLKAKIEEALAGVAYDETRLIQEVTIFLDKACIDEELTRLNSHLTQLGDILNEEETVGKKLDFLVQEINREINTIGSKSNDLEITRTVVEMKTELEKIREQIQNIE